MKKLVKLSLAAAVATAGLTTTASANTLAEAFANAKVSGELKSNYFQLEKDDNLANEKSSIFVNGGNLSLVTGSVNGLSAGVTFQATSVTSIDDDRGSYNKDMNASGVVMSQAYLAYNLNNTTIKAGRQYITTPLVAGSGSRMIKQSFEGIVLVNTDIANTTLVAGYVDKYQHRTSDSQTAIIGDEPEFEQVANGAYTVYAKNNSVENLTAQVQYAVISDNNTTTGDDTTHFYLDGTYMMGNMSIAGQLLTSDNGDASDSNGQLLGVKITNKMDNLTLRAAYTTTDDEAKVISGLGSGADKAFAASPISGGVSAYTADTDSYQIGASYTVNASLALDASYTNWDTNGSDDSSETNLTASYKFDKNLSAKVMYSTYDNTADDYRSRVYVSYKF